ncbi:UNVERIFIED_CONTAM: hypothetical protein Sindi_1684000 [Sesamum indicum]
MEIDDEAPTGGPMIHFGPPEARGVHLPYNDALVISAALVNYIVQRIFVDSGSSTDFLVYKVYQQMELGDILLEPVDTSLYGFAGEAIHPFEQISLPLSLGMEPTRRTRLVHFLVVDMPLAYNFILGRLALNTFRATVSTYHMKLKFSVGDKVGEAKGDQYMA